MSPARPDPVDYLSGAFSGAPGPAWISEPGHGGKFTPDGNAQIWPGNTVICHIDPSSEAHAALIRLQNKIKQSPFVDKFTFLPPSSFHMTVFQGKSPVAAGTKQSVAGNPEGVPLKEVSANMCEQLDGLHLPASHVIKPDGLFALHSMTVLGVDEAQENSLRETRKVLRDATGIHPTDFSRYVFHITLGYLLEWVSEACAREMIALSDLLGAEFARQIPQIELGRCEFCEFKTMHHFEPIKILG